MGLFFGLNGIIYNILAKKTLPPRRYFHEKRYNFYWFTRAIHLNGESIIFAFRKKFE